MPDCPEGSGPEGSGPVLKRTDQAVLSNPANILELGQTIDIVPSLPDVTTLVLVTRARAPGTLEVTDCLKAQWFMFEFGANPSCCQNDRRKDWISEPPSLL